jgi:hypothetical protein
MSTVEIASKCGQALSLGEIARMLSTEQEPEDIQEIIDTDPYFSGFLRREKELVVIQGYENLFSERAFRQKTSQTYLRRATAFADHLVRGSSNVELMAVSGSVAYGSALATDDIDIFLITKSNRTWLCFLEALLLARVFNIKAQIYGDKTNYCLSYVQDAKEFEQVLKQQRTPLFAREFLSMHVLTGIDCYARLLDRNPWMGQMFPRLRVSKVVEKSHIKASTIGNSHMSEVKDALNVFVFAVLQVFLSFKAFVRNLQYRKQQKTNDIFEAKMTKGSCVYTSNKYRKLEKIYASMYEQEA